MSTKVNEIFEHLAGMPQFVDVRDMNITNGFRNKIVPDQGLLNLLNGCLVSCVDDGLRLAWQVDGYETTPHTTVLRDEVALCKFVKLMDKQSKLYL